MFLESIVGSAGGGTGAPDTAEYVVMSLDATLSAERVLTVDNNLQLTDGGANANVTLEQGFARNFLFSGS